MDDMKRWLVLLDYGLQYQTTYVRAINAQHAEVHAESLSLGKARAVPGQTTLAYDQDGPVDFFHPLGAP